MKYYTVSWQKLHKDTYKLATIIEKSGEKFDLIVAMARGGLTISQMLSDFLSLPVASFTITSYKDFQQNKEELKITYKMGNQLTQKKILLVDDVSDSGLTFIHGVKYLQELKAQNIKTAAPYLKTWTKFTPDFYIEKTDKWIIFPTEIKETILAIKKGDDLIKTKIPKFWIDKFSK